MFRFFLLFLSFLLLLGAGFVSLMGFSGSLYWKGKQGKRTAQYSLHPVLLIKRDTNGGGRASVHPKQQKHTQHKALGMTTYLGQMITEVSRLQKN